MRNILIIGGCGYIGSNIVKKLISNNYKPIILDIKNYSGIFSDEIKIIKGDFQDDLILKNILKKYNIEIVIHLISSILPGANSKDGFDSINKDILPTANLLKVMYEEGVQNIVFFSSGGAVYGNNGKTINNENDNTNPIDFYGWSKLSIEKFIKMFCYLNKMNYLIIRPSNSFGYNTNLFAKQGLIPVALGKIIKKEPIEIWGNGEVIRDYIFIDDIAYAIGELLIKNVWNHTFNLGSGIGYSIIEVLEIIQLVTNKRLIKNFLPGRLSDIPVNVLDIKYLQSCINFNDITSIETGIKKFWETINEKK